MGVQFSGKRRYVTLEWPLIGSDAYFILFIWKNRTHAPTKFNLYVAEF